LASNVLAGIELMHMIRKDRFTIEGTDALSIAQRFHVLEGQIRPA
jgi:hypothetical protein